MKTTRTDCTNQMERPPWPCAMDDRTLLTASEECRLAGAIAQGDRNAMSRLVEANLRLVVRVAQDYVGKGLTLDDLIGEGNLGLIRAAQKFDPGYGVRFATYAVYWIKQSIRLALSNSTAIIRLPGHILGLMSKWRKAERALSSELGRAPSFDEVASSLGLSESQKRLLLEAQRARQIKLESTVAPESGGWSSVAASSNSSGPRALAAEDQDDAFCLRARLERLDGRERMVLSSRYGLDNETPMTLREIGNRLGVTREWVRKIELRAVCKLRGDQRGKPGRPRRRSSAPTAELSATNDVGRRIIGSMPAGAHRMDK
jgi:RNA polymerase primary sigma factor